MSILTPALLVVLLTWPTSHWHSHSQDTYHVFQSSMAESSSSLGANSCELVLATLKPAIAICSYNTMPLIPVVNQYWHIARAWAPRGPHCPKQDKPIIKRGLQVGDKISMYPRLIHRRSAYVRICGSRPVLQGQRATMILRYWTWTWIGLGSAFP